MSELAKAYVQIIPSAEGISAGLEETLGGEMDKAGKKGGKKWLGSAASAVMKGTALVAAAAGSAVVKITKDAVGAFAEYEQLKGGVETLFSNTEGTVSAANTVMDNAAIAFQTAGMSANEYMETATSFAAALTSALKGDYEEAARVTDMAIIDMSDNANKMGTDMERIQDAYNGFAKGNYTMLDNLKLGYGGTKTEMQRLLKDAQKLTGVKYNINNLNDVFEAIHAIQENLGIAGTTQEEAFSTISGSMGMLKASWEDLLVGIASGEHDIGTLVDNVTTSFKYLFDNLQPAITKALEGIGTALAAIMPAIGEMLPVLLADLAVPLAQGINGLVAGVSAALPSFLAAIIAILPDLMDTALTLVTALVDGIIVNLPLLADAAVEIIGNLITFLTEKVGELDGSGLSIITELIVGIANHLPELVSGAAVLIGAILSAIIEGLPELANAADEILTALGNGIVESILILADIGGQMIDELLTAFQGTSVYEAGVQVVTDLWEGLKAMWQSVVDWVTDAWNNLISIFDLSNIGNKISEGWDNAVSSVKGAAESAGNWVGEKWDTVTGWFGGSHKNGLDYVPYDGYIAELHQGERVLTAEENRAYSGGGASVNIYAQQLSQADIDYVVEVANRRLGAYA